MKKLAMMLVATSLLLSGCVVYDPPGRDHHDHERMGGHDRDRDGVPNREDRRPNDPTRY